MVGTMVNVGAILGGGLVGVLIGARLPDKMRSTVMHGLGLVCLLIGLQMAMKTNNILIVLGALMLGAMLGEALRIDDAFHRAGLFLQSALARGGSGLFAEGFVTASLVFCVGPMAILGSIQDGLNGDYRLLAIKSMLDGFASIAFAASLGWGVLLSAVPILLYQGAVTLFAHFLASILTDPLIAEMTATGGLIIVGISLRLLEIKELRLASFLPALVVAPLIVVLIPWVKGWLER
ncbi:MAG: DUF554 domain-containing protein [Syntrophobacteraceae bacterium]|jgi:hypothetical protein|nr:DUF554 domain-containing protein [Syntrophobacteraceae bacterium]